MPTPIEYKAPFRPDGFYHIVCKSIDGILLFSDAADYKTFMKRFKQFTAPFLDIWSYSLLGNHTSCFKNKILRSNSWLYHSIDGNNANNCNEIIFNRSKK